MNETIIAALIGAGGGGFLTHGLNVWTASQKVPAERDSIIIDGAEAAVRTLSASLAAETARAERAEAQVRERDLQIDALEQKIDILQKALDALREDIYNLRKTE